MHWQTKLQHVGATVSTDFDALVMPVYRGSTVVFEKAADINDSWRQFEHGYTYGLYGTPTVLELGARIAALEDAHHTFIVPGGQAAIALVDLASCTSGSHLLVPESAYGPSKELAFGLLRGLGVEVEAYDPMIAGGIAELIRPNTALIWTESPGSITMEVQDVPAIVAAARTHGVPVALDNTYSAGVLFDAFGHGVDISIQALTKYVGGHSDVLLGSVSVARPELRDRVGAALSQLGMGVSPDEASLALRGLQTLAVRLARVEASALEVARWLATRPEVAAVLHPALADCPGHDVWKRDFAGSSSVFSFVFSPRVRDDAAEFFVDRLKLFRIGFSWGGTKSLAMVYPKLTRSRGDYGRRLVRLNVGLEDPADLIEDLGTALDGIASGA